MVKIVKGPLEGFFETGAEGTYYSLYDETKMNGDHRSYDGLNIIRPRQHLTILYKDNEVWKGDPGLINTWQALKHTYFKQYVKGEGVCKQLTFGGVWIHHIPTNIDLGLWYQVFFSDSDKFIGILEIEEKEDVPPI